MGKKNLNAKLGMTDMKMTRSINPDKKKPDTIDDDKKKAYRYVRYDI